MAKRHHPNEMTRQRVERLAADGGTHVMIAAQLEISVDTLTRHYAPVLFKAKAAAIMAVGRSVYQRAIAGDNAAAFFYLKCQGGWRESSRVELTFSPEPAQSGVMLIPTCDPHEWERIVAVQQAKLLERRPGREVAGES